MGTYRDLEVWKLGIALSKTIYGLTRTFPKDEMQGLRTQMQQAAISIPTHVAEGFLQSSIKEFLRFLAMAEGCVTELETLLSKAEERQYCQAAAALEIRRVCEQIRHAMDGLKRHLEKKLEESAAAGPESTSPQ